MKRKTGRVLVGAINGVPEFEDFSPKRIWFWRRSTTDQTWPIRCWLGDDEASNPTLAVTTWLGTMIVAYHWHLNSSTPPEEVEALLADRLA